EEIDTHPALFLGVEPDQGYKTTTVSVQPSDKLLLYTDGLTEPLNDAGEQYGERVFGEFLRSRAGLEPSEILAGLAVSMEGFTTENLRDDVAIVCVKVE
ncbi:MAG TPA: PP2C family protein-serine/threonine phosphatase, partial [Leptospiraceae bacterium]|nr:PP2C family protein-serine/threonine phosphatase [Leptospiraceae bacterium]